MKKIIDLIATRKKYFVVGVIVILVLIMRSRLLKKPDDRLTYIPVRETMIDTVIVSGTYTTASQTQVISPSNGVIAKLYVENNDQVEKGDSLFYIESTATTEEKATAYASYLSSVNSLRTAQQNKENYDAGMWTKQKALLDAQNSLNFMNDKLLDNSDNPSTGDKYTDLEISSIQTAADQAKKDFSAAEKQYKEADGGIGSAQAAVTSSKLAYDATKSITVKAPASGKVVNLLKTIGDGVTASTATKIASPVLIIANLENPYITAKVSEAYISRLIEEQKAEIVFDAARDQSFAGFIEAIDTVGTDVAGVVTYDARITIKDIDPSIKPNMTGVITIETFRKDDVLSVPNSAIYHQDGKSYLERIDGNGDLTEVELGVKGLTKTEIASGLDEGIEIVSNIDSN